MKSAEEREQERLEQERLEQEKMEAQKKLQEDRDALQRLSEQANEVNATESESTLAERISEKDDEVASSRRPTVFMDDPDEGSADVNKAAEELPSWETKVDKEKAVFSGLSWLKSVCIGVVVGVLLVVFVIQRNNVYGTSMEPNLYEGDVIFAEKISTYFDNYERGDIVVLDGSNMEGYSHDEYLIKRIIGLPGETIKIDNGIVYIKKVGADDFEVLSEPYLTVGTITTVSGTGYSKGYNEITLSSTEYFCMGDNRVPSNDSRNLGPFTQDRIKGVALFRVYPFGSFGKIK